MNTKPDQSGSGSYGVHFKASCLLLSLSACLFSANGLATSLAYRPETGICGAAVDGELEKVIEYLKANPTAMTERDAGRTPLHWASESGRTNVVEYLLSIGVDAKLGDAERFTPLHSAAAFRHTGVVKSLLDHGADPKAVAEGGYSVLLSACSGWPKKEIIELLIEAGADPNVKSDDGVTPLQKLSFREPPETLKLLLAAGVNVNQVGWEGTTALHWAIDGDNVEVAHLLAESGADDTARNEKGTTALARVSEKAAQNDFGRHLKWKRVASILAKNAKLKEPASVESPTSKKPAHKFNRRHKNT